MMFLEQNAAPPGQPALAISQPMHAWIAGQLVRAWAGLFNAVVLPSLSPSCNI
jgi:hypothetical protein